MKEEIDGRVLMSIEDEEFDLDLNELDCEEYNILSVPSQDPNSSILKKNEFDSDSLNQSFTVEDVI
jgi:hypothetical protein